MLFAVYFLTVSVLGAYEAQGSGTGEIARGRQFRSIRGRPESTRQRILAVTKALYGIKGRHRGRTGFDELQTGYAGRNDKRGMSPWIQRVSDLCSMTEDGHRLFRCPSHGSNTRVCIDDYQLCDGRQDCPGMEDEDATACLFHKVTMSYMDMMSNSIVQLTSALIGKRRKR